MACTLSSRAVSASRSLSRPVMATRAPLAASDWATARPIPLLPPVINATAFLRFILFPPLSCKPWDIATARQAASLRLIGRTATLGCPPWICLAQRGQPRVAVLLVPDRKQEYLAESIPERVILCRS